MGRWSRLAVTESGMSPLVVLARVLKEKGRYEEAAQRLRQALSTSGDDPAIHLELGSVLLDLGQAAAALEHYRKVLVLGSPAPVAHVGVGRALAALGRLEQAREAFRAAALLAPDDAQSYYHLSMITRFESGSPEFEAMRELTGRGSSLSTDDQIALHFALGKAFSDLGRFEESFEHLSKGNALKRRQARYDEAQTLGLMERIKATFTKELIRQKSQFGNSSDLPVFIVGMQRSGSTLVEQILASHPDCFGAGELPYVGAIARDLRGSSSAVFPEAVQALSAEEIQKLGAGMHEALERRSPHARRITDKMPNNFLYLGLISILFPRARVIHTRRDPRDTAISCFATLFGEGLVFSCDLGELGRFYKGYRALMAHWREVLPQGMIHEVDYEALVDDFEAQARRLISHVGLAWEPACLSFHTTERAVMTPSVAQVRQPVYRRSVGRWRNYEKFLQPFIAALED